jgi:citrate synthase
METRDMSKWETAIAKVVSEDGQEEIIVRGHKLSGLIGKIGFAEMIFLLLQGRLPEPAQAAVLDGLLVASLEHGIAPPSMIARCFASYGTEIQSAVAGGILAFGDRMGGLGEQLARLMAAAMDDIGGDPAALRDDELRRLAVAIVARAAADGQRVPGYGIPLHGADPRAPLVLDLARRHGTFGPYCKFAVLIEDELARSRGGKRVAMNLDGVSACVILDLGFPWSSTRLFLLTARSISMGAHYLEEKSQDTTWRHIPAGQISYQD